MVTWTPQRAQSPVRAEDVRRSFEIIVTCLAAIGIFGCSSRSPTKITTSLGDPTQVSSVRTMHGRVCDFRYQHFVQNRIDWLRASGQFDHQHACSCLAMSKDYIRKQMSRPEESYWKHLEIKLARPFPLSAILPTSLEAGKVESILISGWRNPTGVGTFIYLGFPDHAGRIKYLVFRYRADFFNLNYRPIWFNPRTWGEPAADPSCRM